ncbi:MAG TPA: type VI secretion system tube protein Hcp [Usitatibacter sp.]|nr:type VI secretion system tube protein Hcp [Usitatibacter sp.]
MRRIVLACFVLSASAAFGGNMSLTLSGLPAIQVTGFSTGASMPVSISSGTGGAGIGKVSFKEFAFKATESSATPMLMQKLSTGTHLPGGTLQVRSLDGTRLVAEWDLTDVFVVSVDVNNGASDPRGRDASFFATPETSFSVVFAKYCYKVFAADGTTIASQMCFNLATGSAT